MATQVTLKGPLFSAPRRTAALDGAGGMRHRILDSVTKSGYKAVMGILQRRIKKPTPYYWTLIRIDDLKVDHWEITDGGGFGYAVYNHWLEGDGSRNYPVTSFKGYHAWALTYARLSKRAGRLAQTQVGRTVRRLGGRVIVPGEEEA